MVNIQTVIANLQNTIRGKETYLSEIYYQRELNKGADPASYAVAEFLELNIKELNAILTDCMAVREAEQEPVARRWLFVETPGEFTQRLRSALAEFGDLLPAVRYVLIEDPPLYAAPVRTKDLTDDEIDMVLALVGSDAPFHTKYRAVIAADREKNK